VGEGLTYPVESGCACPNLDRVSVAWTFGCSAAPAPQKTKSLAAFCEATLLFPTIPPLSRAKRTFQLPEKESEVPGY